MRPPLDEKRYEMESAYVQATSLAISYGTLVRWCHLGVKDRSGQSSRIYLEHDKIGGRYATSVEAIQRFIDRTSERPTVPLLNIEAVDRSQIDEGLARHYPKAVRA